MNKRVYGVLGVKSIMANWNADFSGYPKTTSEGDVFGSDKAFKYPTKKMWDENGEKILYIKSLKFSGKEGEEILVPRSLKERYEQLFNIPDLKKNKSTKEVLINLFKASDVIQYGATFAEEGNNISITGAVQIGQGFNKYEASETTTQPILSPFRDGKDIEKKKQEAEKKKKKNEAENEEDVEEAKSSTLGTKTVSTEAHYFYPFAINPIAYKNFKEMGVTEGYTEEDYRKFKEASITAATSYSTNAKIGCENEFGMFVETEQDLYLPNLSEYIVFEKGDEKDIIEINCAELLNEVKDKIKSVEIYYNPYKTIIKSDIEGAKLLNIFTQKEV